MRFVVEAMCHAGGIFAVIAIDRVGARRSWAPGAFSTRSDGHIVSAQQIHVRLLKTGVFGNSVCGAARHTVHAEVVRLYAAATIICGCCLCIPINLDRLCSSE
jgi:hypothetical protein